MVQVETTTTITKPVKTVADFAAEPDNAPLWYVNIKSVKWETAKPLKIGSKIKFSAEFLGRKLEYTYKVTDYQPGNRLVMRTDEGPFPMETTYIWQGLEKNLTHMQLINRGQPSGFSRLVAPFMKWAMRKANQDDLKKLKSILENGSA